MDPVSPERSSGRCVSAQVSAAANSQHPPHSIKFESATSGKAPSHEITNYGWSTMLWRSLIPTRRSRARAARCADTSLIHGSTIMKMITAAQPRTAPIRSPAAIVLQRRCNCGKHTSVGARCEPCDGQGTLQQATSQPPIASAFKHDFSRIPVHSELSARFEPELTVSTPGDLHERQADAMADRVMRMSGTDSSSRQPDQTRSFSHGGENMEPETRSFMQRRFGADFSSVRIHTDARAARISREMGAQAFTVGHDVYFAVGHYEPHSDRGRHLLAHELAHTIQQGHSRFQRCPSAIQQGITGLVDIPEETPRYEQQDAGSVEPMIQRSATWTGAAVHEDLSPAEVPFGGDRPKTWQLLNGTKLETSEDADQAIKVPTVTTTGAGKHWKAKIDNVPAQEGSGDESVIDSGPWTKKVTMAEAGAVTRLAACKGPGDSTFSEHGKPSDKEVYKSNRRHEDHHLVDHKVAFEDAIGRWDKKVQNAKDKGLEFEAASAAAATGVLWTAMGNTPQNAARSYRSQAFSKGDAYHKTPAGGPMVTSNPFSNADCSVSSLDVTSPA